MYYVCQIRNNVLGQMNEFEDIEDAKAFLKNIVAENDVELTDEVLDEINADWSYLSEDREWSVCIGTVG